MRMRLCYLLAACTLGLAACSIPSENPTFADMKVEGDEGANCTILFSMRDDYIDPNDADFDRASAYLRSVGCFSPTSKRSDTGAAEPQSSPWKDFDGERVEPSPACAASMEAADEDAQNEVLLTRTLTDCESANEWLSALERNPGAMWLVGGTPIGKLDLQTACHTATTAPVCRDAASAGVPIK